MKLLLFSDLHCDVAAARRIVSQATEVDIVVGAGDFASGRHNLHPCLDVVRHLTCPVVMVAGNNESTEELQAACASWDHAHVLHGASVIISGISFFGLGGGVPVTPFGSWSYDFTEQQAAKLLEPCPDDCVLISHSPPKGFCDRSSSGQSLGSTAVLETVKRSQPRLVVCGHIHASAGLRETTGRSVVVNAGPDGVIVEVES